MFFPAKIVIPSSIPRYKKPIDLVELHVFIDTGESGTLAIVYAIAN